MNSPFGWKVKILKSFRGYEILLYGNDRPRSNIVTSIQGDLVTVEETTPGNEIKPTMVLDQETMENLLQAAKEADIKTKSQSLVEGQLEATKYHLEDMRTLMKLKPGIYGPTQ